MRWRIAWMTLVLLVSAGGANAQSYIDRLYEAGQAAEELMRDNAGAWRRSNPIVKDRVGFMIFQRSFARKNDLSQDDMIACIDDVAVKAEPTRGVEAMIFECMNSARHRD